MEEKEDGNREKKRKIITETKVMMKFVKKGKKNELLSYVCYRLVNRGDK